ncbi:hypothetical protein VYU27_008652 [Nannochloropsis oceanica]
MPLKRKRWMWPGLMPSEFVSMSPPEASPRPLLRPFRPYLPASLRLWDGGGLWGRRRGPEQSIFGGQTQELDMSW